jgi:tetratricopeptide (TPR) repeat protein
MRHRWLSAVLSRISDSAWWYAVLDDAALAEAVQLVATTIRASDLPETCHAVGMLHWHRALALGPEQAGDEVQRSVPFLTVARMSGSPLPLPEAFVDIGAVGSVTGPDQLWEALAAAIQPWLQTGADPHYQALALGIARNWVGAFRPGDPSRATPLSLLSAVALSCFEHTGDPAALDEAISAGRAAVREAAADDPNLPGHLTHLAATLRVSYEYSADVEVLRSAVEFGRQAVRATAIDSDQREVPLSALAAALRLLYRRTGDGRLLEEASDASRAAVEATPDEAVARAVMLTNHAAVLHEQAEQSGDPSVLNELIAVNRQAADTAPENTPLNLSCRYNLATALGLLFDSTGSIAALDESIEIARAVVEATPAEHPDAPLHQGHLVRMMHAQFEVSGRVDLLDQAIAISRHSVAATPATHVNRAMFLGNLATALQTRAEHTDDLDQLREAIDLIRLAARSAAGGSHEASMLSNLVTALRQCFARTGDEGALDQAIATGRVAVAAAPPDHPARAVCEVNLAGALDDRGLRDDAIELLRAAAGRRSARPSVRVEAAWSWGRLAMELGEGERALRGYALAVELLPQVAARSLRRDDASRWLRGYAELASDAAACALTAEQPDRAVELLEFGRGVLLAQAIETRSDLTELREVDPELAARFQDLCGRLDAADEDSADLRREWALELDTLLSRIRSLPGLNRFLLPPDAAGVAAHADAGPIVLVNPSRYRSDAIILTGDGIRVQELPDLTPKSLTEHLALTWAALDSRYGPRTSREEAEAAILATLAWLWDTVTGPVLNRLDADGHEPLRRVWWVPCGALAALPLHAAGHHTTATGARPPTVMDRVASSYIPTIRSLAHARSRPRRSPRRPPCITAVAMPRTPDARDLPGAERELEALRHRFPNLNQLVGADATRDAVLSRLLGSEWVHFACHAVSDPDHPSESRLLVHDHVHHRLRVAELSRLNLTDARFAYLSACSTAVTTTDLANESIHIVSACLLAGYPHVIGTLWEIEDTFAADVAESVYNGLAAAGYDAERAGECLNQTVRWARDRCPDRPTLWAAYVHTGP